MSASRVNAVFYAESYHPIQAGSIDGTDTLPHDNAVYRALLCSSAGLYDPFGDPKATGDPYCTVFVGRLNHLTTEDTLHKAMSKYGRIKNLRLVRHIVTGASRGYAFVEYETEREMRRAYEDAHHSFIDDCEIIVDYNRQQLMPGWIPRRLGGGLGGKKESGQLRFGGRERPFRAPLRPIPLDDLKKLGIPPPPEGRYRSRFQVPPLPRRRRSSMDREEPFHRRSSMDREEPFHRRSSMDREDRYHKDGSVDGEEFSHKGSSFGWEDHYHKESSVERDHWEEHSHKRSSKDRRSSIDRDGRSHKRSSTEREARSHKRSSTDRDERSNKRSSVDQEERSNKRSSGHGEEQQERLSHGRSSTDWEEHSHRNSKDRERNSHKRHRHNTDSHRH